MKRCTLIILSLLLAVFSVSVLGAQETKEISQKLRDIAVVDKLKASPNTVAAYAKGLCCPSCGIGIRKKISKLSFVDKSRFNKGVELDASTQIVSIAVKRGERANAQEVAKSIQKAGYDPVHFYQVDNGKLKTVDLD